MARHAYFIAISVAVLVIHATDAGVPFRKIDADCLSPDLICNSLKKARECRSYDWCRKQAIACGAKKLLLQGSPILWGNSLRDLDGYCDNRFEPFKKLYASANLVNIDVQVRPGQESFRISFDFSGNVASKATSRGVRIEINEQLVYDDFNSRSIEPQTN